jgi:hypothetical protein
MLVRAAYTQEATYWGAPVHNNWGGTDYGQPRVIMVRWHEKTERFLNREGQDQLSNAIVFLPEEIDEFGYLAMGDVSNVAKPEDTDKAFQIQRIEIIPDLRNLNKQIMAYL